MMPSRSRPASVLSHTAKNNRKSIKKSGSVSRVLYPAYKAGGDHLSRPTVAGRLCLATSDLPAGRAAVNRSYPGRVSGLLGLAGGGVYPAGAVTGAAVRSYRTISPLPVPMGTSAVYFLWHFPAGRPGWPLATTVPCPARTFLPRFCLRQKTRGRPPDPLFLIDIVLLTTT